MFLNAAAGGAIAAALAERAASRKLHSGGVVSGKGPFPQIMGGKCGMAVDQRVADLIDGQNRDVVKALRVPGELLTGRGE